MKDSVNKDLRYKHECMVRQLIMYRKEWGLAKFREYLAKSNFKNDVINDFQYQWMKGNRANEKGEWK